MLKQQSLDLSQSTQKEADPPQKIKGQKFQLTEKEHCSVTHASHCVHFSHIEKTEMIFLATQSFLNVFTRHKHSISLTLFLILPS